MLGLTGGSSSRGT